MSSLNFPTNPYTGQIYVLGNTTYRWNGVAWAIVPSATSSVFGTATVTNFLTVTTSTQSTSTTTGGIVTTGGVGVGGAVNIQNTSTIGGAVILTTATIIPYVNLQSSTNYGNSTTNRVLILNTTSANGTGTGALIVYGGISASGDLYLGGSLYVGGVPLFTTSTLISSLNSGTDISLTYSGSGTITISDTATLQTITNRGSTTTNSVNFSNTTNSTSTTSGAVVIAGGLGVGGNIYSAGLQITDAVITSSQTTVNTTATTAVDRYPLSSYRSAKYVIQIDDGVGASANFQVIELLLLVDNVNNVYATEYAVLTSAAGELGDFAAGSDGTNVTLYFTPYNPTSKILKVLRTAMTT
jgi:hypothetical protein